MAFEVVKKNLEARGFAVTVCETAADAAEYLNKAIDDKTVGIGGSLTRVAGVASAEFRRGRGERTDDPECGIVRLAEALEEWGHGHA